MKFRHGQPSKMQYSAFSQAVSLMRNFRHVHVLCDIFYLQKWTWQKVNFYWFHFFLLFFFLSAFWLSSFPVHSLLCACKCEISCFPLHSEIAITVRPSGSNTFLQMIFFFFNMLMYVVIVKCKLCADSKME